MSRVDDAEAALRSMIVERRRTGGLRLPPEKELSEQLGVSRATLRAALTRLESDGEIVRRRRVGTVITTSGQGSQARSSLAYPIDMIHSLSDYLSAVGVAYTFRAVAIRRDAAGDEVAAALDLTPGTSVFTATRLFEVEGAPAAFLEHHLPTVLNGHQVHIESLTGGVNTFLRETEHIGLTYSESIVTAVAASAELARELQLDTGVALLVMHATVYSGPTPVSYGRLVFRPDTLCMAVSGSEDARSEFTGGLHVARRVDTGQPDRFLDG